ncbi:hypothetical protein [Candidatus Nitronereus thalassa]|uniref:Probable chemoreceptor glutamine deamidase CheD n=1 Tax=Candidatus Nitronereus thalassa TaxID=3020898 RepID=A0ABU3K654_9BACT|nr:hypothetical protein [Candidatus Nitronereus thalassa]MDT7041890.1 hypothetical protein [Candidatus Nitronereus thalassa]
MEFGHIRRMRDMRFPHEIAVIMPGEFFVSRAPMVVYTVLGSCISVCIRDTVTKIGGMNHFMLASPSGNVENDHWGPSARYGSYAMEVLVNELLGQGGHKSRFEVKVFGGGKIYEGRNDVGAKNAAWALEYLEREGMQPIKADVGDVCPRKVYYFTESGRVLLKKLDGIQRQQIVKEEQQYQQIVEKEVSAGDVTLF